jgi:hypothetical protein
MELRQKDERRCETANPRRFKIDKLEERIAPSGDAACNALLRVLANGASSGNSQGQVAVARAADKLCS